MTFMPDVIASASFLSEPAVVAGLVSVLVAILTPYVSEKIRARSQDATESAVVEVRKMDGLEKFYADLQARLERTERDNDELNEEVLQLKSVVFAWEGRFEAVASDLNRIRETLEAERPQVSVAVSLLVQLLDKMRRRDEAREEERAG